MRRVALALAALATAALAAPSVAIAPFSASRPGGELPAGWRLLLLRRVAPAEIGLVAPGTSQWSAYTGREAPAINGIAAGNDTDQTGERATAWFSDFRLEPRS